MPSKAHTNARGATMRRTIFMLFAIPLMLAGTLTSGPASAHFVPAPCDFITGGGFIFGNSGQFINFGAHGGCKNGQFWGHVNVLDHSYNPPAHLRSTNITGYLMDPAFPNARDICGEGVVDGGGGGVRREAVPNLQVIDPLVNRESGAAVKIRHEDAVDGSVVGPHVRPVVIDDHLAVDGHPDAAIGCA